MITWQNHSSSIHIAQLLPPHTEQRQPPINLGAGDEALYAHEFKRNWGACKAVALDDISVVGSSWVQWRYWRAVDGFRPGHDLKRRKLGRIRDLLQLRHPPQQLVEALWVHDDWSGNYFHWLTDVLPKLLAWQHIGDACRQVILPEVLLVKHYVRESLERMGFQGIGFSKPHLHVRHLIVIGPTAPTGNFRSNLLNEIRDQLGLLGCNNSENRLYVSRSDAATRFLLNELDLATILNRYDIQSVRLEGRSLAEQIDLFSSCSLLIGLHGAGLANMLWMPAGGHVIEIRRRDDSINNCYFSMANALGHHYSYILADDVESSSQGTQIAELRISPQLLEGHLQMVTSC